MGPSSVTPWLAALWAWTVSIGPGFGNWVAEEAAAPLLVGLVIAIWLPQVNQRLQARREQVANAVEALRSQLVALRIVSTRYWMSSYSRQASAAEEAEIEFLLQDIGALVGACSPYLWKNEADAGPRLVSDLMAAATGPAFGQRVRRAEPSRLPAVIGAMAAINREVLARRRRFFH